MRVPDNERKNWQNPHLSIVWQWSNPFSYYDSERDELVDVGYCCNLIPLIHHKCKARRVWDLMTVLCLIYLMIFMPVQLAFDINSSFTDVMGTFIDVFFILDLLLNFITTYDDESKAFY